MMTPENVIPINEYTAEFDDNINQGKDEHLLSIIDEIEEIKNYEDVRVNLS
jgi:hypothetical protein